MRLLTGLLFLWALPCSAQVDLPVFGKQDVINGYAKDVEGEVLSYFSVYPEHATTALLTRCTDGKKAIAWETAAVPFSERESVPYYYFSWIAAHNSTTSGGDRSFDLYINDAKALTFTTHHSTSPGTWSAAGADSTKLVFEYSKMDRHGDAHGFAHLRVPRKYVKLGEPVKLKVVGHAQDSPDWFMTFRYTFGEKVEVEALPFLLKDGAQDLLITLMHFGGPEILALYVNDPKPTKLFKVNNGLNIFHFPIHAAQRDTVLNIRARIPTKVDDPSPDLLDVRLNVRVQPVIHRDIHLVHHSHNDIGYSHLQTEVEKIQNKNIYDALDLIDRTKDYPEDSRFVWNVESLWAVENFLGVASEADKQRFIAAVKSGSIALSVNYANILTGLCTPEEMHWIVEYADSLRKWYGLPITMAIVSDIPGMRWSMVEAYTAHGIRHLSQGPNYIPDLPDGGDRIGSTLREQGDKPYWWKGTTGRDSVLVWTAGQGYGGWHGFTAGAIKERGTRKIAAYMNELAAKGYPFDMVQWRYNIVSDNGPVDSTLSDFVREWNAKYASPRLIIANAGTMMQEFETKYGKQIPTWSGDFTPYWEDGAYSTAKEEGDVRVLSARLTNLIEAAKILGKPIDPHLLYRAKRSIVMWHEHTWGAWCSISDPDAHFTTDQWRVKKAFADSGWHYFREMDAALLPDKRSSDTLVVINALPWQRDGYVEFRMPGAYDHSSIESSTGEVVPVQVMTSHMIGAYLHNLPALSAIKIWPSNKKGRVINDEYSAQTSVNRIRPDSASGALDRLFGIDVNYADTSLYDGMLEWLYVNGLDPNITERPVLKRAEWFDKGPLFKRLRLESELAGGKIYTDIWEYGEGGIRFRSWIEKHFGREKQAMHLALPFADLPEPTIRIGFGDTCATIEQVGIPGSNKDYFSGASWIDISSTSETSDHGITVVCRQGAIWEVGEMVDERKVNPGKGTNPEYYKAWKTEAKSSSTIYLYGLNNYWHTNFKADQEGPITFDLYLKMHGPFKLEDARRFGLEMTRPLITWWK